MAADEKLDKQFTEDTIDGAKLDPHGLPLRPQPSGMAVALVYSHVQTADARQMTLKTLSTGR